MREIKIAKCVIEQDGYYLFQQRDFDPSRGAVNLLGSYGGKIEKGESPLQAIVRELSEETNILVHSSELKELGSVKVISDNHNEEVIIFSTVFYIKLDDEFKVESNDGQLVMIRKNEIKDSIDKLTPATKAAFEYLIKIGDEQ